MVNGIHYINDGDWIENCSALVEDNSGELSLIHFNEYLKHSGNVSVLADFVKTGKAA